jgi:hypothetical protein
MITTSKTLSRILTKYQSEKSVSRHNRSPVSYKIKQEHVTFILDEINKNKTITMEDLLALLHHKFPDLDLSRRHLARIVHDNNVSLKITQIRHEPSKRYGKEININQGLLQGN